MYEQNKISVISRIVWLILSLLVIAGLVWFLLWLFIWRGGNDTASNKTATQTTKTNQSTNGSSTGSTSEQPVSSAPTTSAGVMSSTSTTEPALANTGPGDIMVPIVVAVAGGTLYYNVRLRRKLQH